MHILESSAPCIPASTMQLPNELILLICSYISNESLWALTQVSSRIRSVTIFCVLARHQISESDVKSGIITLKSESFFLILVVANLHPIQRLEAILDIRGCTTSQVQRVVRALGRVLSAVEPIPEIWVETNWYLIHTTTILHLAALLPQTRTRAMILLTDNCDVHISRPRKTPLIRWEPIPSMGHRRLDFPTPVPAINYLLAGIPFLFTIFIYALSNCRIALVWVYGRLFGPVWDREARLNYDLWYTPYAFRVRIQTNGNAFTFLMIWTSPPRQSRTIRPVEGLGDDELSAAVSAMDLNPLRSIWIEEDANISQSDFHVFLRNHPDLRALGLRPNAIRASSFRIPDASGTTNIVSLSAPALYIPHLIPIAPLLTNISIEFHPTRASLNIPEYRRALDSVGSLAGTHVLTLILSFPSDARNFPWVRIPDDDARTPEVRLHRVTHLLVGGNLTGADCGAADSGAKPGAPGFGAETLRALPRWIRLFPALKTVIVRPGTRQEAIPASEQQELLKAIADACQGEKGLPV
ncbi:hypothetical protein C8R45DRAFT_392800 [Mycena sanguinolenta]|nr:hypothetical protein C8R45DRAFT_392800 [Mycena sanguinolenta]